MFYRTIFVCVVGLILVKLVKMDSLNISEVTFKTNTKIDEKHVVHFICDHNDNHKLNNIYTVLEGEEFKIITKHNSLINHLICRDFSNGYQLYDESSSRLKSLTTFIAKKQMGSLWTCTVLSNRDSSLQQPVVLYEGHTYSAAYCSMQIHVRQTNPPQTILVNNVALQAVRTDLSEKDVDFTAEYQYIDGDVVNVACITFLGTARLTIEYPMADTLSDKFTSGNLSSSQAIGFYTKLHSGHNNSYMTCTSAELTDYTKVMVRFVMRTEFNVRVKINGMTLRPKLHNAQYRIEYKYISNLPIKVVCEVVRADMVLVVTDSQRGFVGEVNGYNKTELKPSKQSEMSFHLYGENKTLSCGSDYSKGGSAELITIKFSESKFPTERPPHMELPPNGTVMELYDYDDDKSRNVIFYEFEDGERLQLKCGPLHSPQPGPVLHLRFQDSRCRVNGCYVTLYLTVTDQHDNSEIVCRLMGAYFNEKVFKEIRVILRKRVLTTVNTTTTTSTTTTTTTTTAQPKDHEPVPEVVVSVLREAAVRGRSGGAATLACEARYEPPPRDLPLPPLEIRWQKGEQPISLQGSHWGVALHTRRASSVESRLTLTELSTHDAGAYSCSAAGRAASLTLTLDDDGQKSTKTNALAYSLSSVGVLIIVVVLVLYLKARKRCCYRSRAQEMPLPRPDPASVFYENTLSVFAPINEREAEAMENHYEEIQ